MRRTKSALAFSTTFNRRRAADPARDPPGLPPDATRGKCSLDEAKAPIAPRRRVLERSRSGPGKTKCGAGQDAQRQRSVTRAVSLRKGDLFRPRRHARFAAADKTEENSAPISNEGGTPMVRMVARLIAVALFALSLPLAVQAKTFVLDLARIARRSGLDLFSRWREHVGEGHRPNRQDVVPQRRRALAAGGDPRRHRREGRRHRHHEPRSRQPRRRRQGSARGRHPGHQLQHARPESELHGLRRRRPSRRRKGLGAISRRSQAGEVRRLRLDAGRGSGRELWRRGEEGHRRASSGRSTSRRK